MVRRHENPETTPTQITFRAPTFDNFMIRMRSISSAGTCRGSEAPCRSGGGFAPSSSPNCARSGRESAAHFRKARAPGSRAGTAPCATPSLVHRALTSPQAQNPPPTRSAAGESPAATETFLCPSSSAPKCRAWSPALRARRGRLPNKRRKRVQV